MADWGVAEYGALASATAAAGSAVYGATAGGAPKAPPSAPPPPPTMQSPDTLAAAQQATMRARAAAGFGSTIGTSPLGVTGSAPTTGKSLLGS